MRQRYFTIDEAEAAVPRLRDLMGEARELKRRADAKVSQWRTGGTDNPADMALARGQVEFLLSEVARRLEMVTEIGCVPKDLERGLVDFPTRLPGKGEAYFCWGLDDGGVTHWHGLTEGFGGRKPIEPILSKRETGGPSWTF